MTYEQFYRALLADRGLMFGPQKAAWEAVVTHDRMKAMERRWDQAYEPDNPLNATLWWSIKLVVGEWLDANFPEFPGREEFR